MLRAVIFDLDGTLGNTLPVCFAALRDVFRRRIGRTFTDAEITSMFGPSEEGIIRQRVLEDPESAVEEFLVEYDRAHSACTEPFPGVREALSLLRERGKMLGIITGKGPRSAEISLRHLGIAGSFDAVRAGSPEGDRKPESITGLLAEWEIGPQEAAYVGDSPSDMRSAREAGVAAVAAAWAETADRQGLQAEQPDLIFDSVEAFASWAVDECG